jgi:hypothetical protein
MTDMRRQIRKLEAAALAGHAAEQTWRDFFAANVGTITNLIRRNPAGWPTMRERLLALLVSGDTSGRLAVGDEPQDEPQAIVGPCSDTLTRARCLWPPEAKR